MRITNLSFLIIFIFYGCSFKTPKNQWEYNSTSAFNSYTKYFLQDDDIMAKSYFESAVKYAKQSADLNQLSKLYLGSCALNISVNKNDKCDEYTVFEELIDSMQSKAYYSMLTNTLDKKSIQYLPKQYKQFSENLLKKRYNKAFIDIQNMKQETSQFIAASLMQKSLNKVQINYLIDKASFYGYKKIVLFWLERLLVFEKDISLKTKIAKKIKILKK